MTNATIPAGYQQTEVGIIPEDWEVNALLELTTKITDGTHDTPTPVKVGVPFLTAIHVKENFVDFENCSYLSNRDHEVIFARCNPQYGDVLMVNIGAGVSTTALVNVDYEFSLKNVALLKPDSNVVYGQYLNYSLMRLKPEIKQALMSGGAQPFLSLAQIKVPLPTKREQTAIASALSDMDALLDGLDRLITKKRNLKQAAMQQLLTGKTRLAGFEEEWEVRRLGDVCTMKSGAGITAEQIDNHSTYPCYGGNGLRGFTTEFTHDGHYALIGRQGALCGNVLGVSGKFFASEHALVVTPFPEIDIHWLTFVMGRMNLNQYSESSAQPGLSAIKLLILDITCPNTTEEQEAIAAVLSDMDAEIAALEQRRTKTRDIKQGMMQELLTGRTRLV